MKIQGTNQRITQKEKDAEDHKYYKDQLDMVDGQAFSRVNTYGDRSVGEHRKMKVNYDLFNNKLDTKELTYVCQPFGSDVGELPASMQNRDIVSPKIKSIMGMELKRPFSMGCLAVNPEATTRKEQKEFGMVKDFVMSEIMRPIQEEIELKYQQQQAGRELTPDEQEQIKSQIAQETQAQTPPEVKKYMTREHQDPAEVLSNQLFRYLMPKERIIDKFHQGFKHALLSGREVYLVGLRHNEPFLKVINPLYFDYAKNMDGGPIEDSSWAVAEFHMNPSEVISQFRKELGKKNVDEIYENYRNGSMAQYNQINTDTLFNFAEDIEIDKDAIRVIYSAWKGERKVGFLDYYDDNQMPQMMMVSENYVFNPEMGDINLDWEWIPETHHGYKICLADPIYVGMGSVPGQHNDLDEINTCSLPFIGHDYDDMNSETTSHMDRLKAYQYYYNVILYRIELLMASDKGKVLMMNIKALPTSAGIDVKKFQYFLESNKIAYFDPNDEGNKKGLSDVNTLAKVMDMSLASDIAQYMNMAEYIERKCGDAIGLPRNVESSASPNESVRNVQTSISNSSNILEPTFQLHNGIKREVLQRIIEVAKVGYSEGKPRKLAYFLDDLSQGLLDLNPENLALLANSTIGIFVQDTTNANDAKELVKQLAHAAMQTAQLDLLDVVKVIKAEGIQEAEEALEVGTNRKAEQLAQQQQQQQAAAAELEQKQNNHEKEKWQHEEDIIVLKETERRKTEIQKQTILSLGFNVDKDMDKDGTPDVLEVARFGVDADIQNRKMALEETKQADDVRLADKKLKIEEQKNQIMKSKVNN